MPSLFTLLKTEVQQQVTTLVSITTTINTAGYFARLNKNYNTHNPPFP